MQVSTFVKKADARFETDFDQLPQASREFIISYGYRQIIADACASAKTEGEALGMCQKRHDNLVKGILRSERESDPVAVEAKAIATKLTTKWARENGIALTAKDDADSATKAQVETNQATFIARVAKLKVDERVLAQAKANVAALADLEIDVDLG